MSEPITRHLQLEALMTAASWPGASPQTTLALAGQFLAARRYAEGQAYFQNLTDSQPEPALPLALAGFFQAQLGGDPSDAIAKLDAAVDREPGLPHYFRGLVFAALPAGAGRAEDAVADLELVLALRERFPVGMLRAVNRGLANAYAQLGHPDAQQALSRAGGGIDPDFPVLTADYWVTDRDGFRFVPPKLTELADGIHIAQGYDFADIAFVTTAAGIVAIDAGSTEANARAARDALRAVSSRPISHVILTHAHFDHIGGLAALLEPGTEVIAQVNFAAELELQNEMPIPYARFLPAGATHRHKVTPDRLISRTETLTEGGVDFVLHPVHGGETDDALVIQVPDRGVVFVGDVTMPYLGAPFFPEGSAEGLFDAMQLIEDLRPRLLVHGHAPLTETFTIAVFPALRAALREVYDLVRSDLRDGRTLTELLQRNHLPEVLRTNPAAVLPCIVVRDNLIARVHRQRTGYWQPDGEGVEHVSSAEWAAALDVLAGGKVDTFTDSVGDLLDRGDLVLALRLADLALLRHPTSEPLTRLRRQALHRLLERDQGLNPFKFLLYSELAAAELLPIDSGRR